eukprot:CAMPEP_0115004238 /NCGR_PEP_ID=MMETSP0216-20121206/19078_1 /TAXON_ID=223996 /ORGANISM="Protocruzia adherens, Strain Boccale" /LENGTH=356 /DNA_ID=CAMNT_0002370177 /DNA_START=45 /DNA_END=1112 /DNA_ORIENTATION=+
MERTQDREEIPRDFTNIYFGSQIGLRSVKYSRYLSCDSENSQATVTGSHPSLVTKELRKTCSEELTILSFHDQKYDGPVTFGSAVMLQSYDGNFLTFNAAGELRLEGKSRGDQGEDVHSDTWITKLAKWYLLDANNVSSRRAVSCFDDVVFKSPFEHHMICESNLVISAQGPAISADTTWKIVKAGVPYMPDWTFTRPSLDQNHLVFSNSRFLSSDYSSSSKKKLAAEKNQLGSMPIYLQEQYLIEDILWAMMSLEGTYIKRKVSKGEGGSQLKKMTYEVEPYLQQPTADVSLLNIAKNILTICSNHDKIRIFINIHSQFEYGRVSHALCSAITQLLREYTLLITQLDSEFNQCTL